MLRRIVRRSRLKCAMAGKVTNILVAAKSNHTEGGELRGSHRFLCVSLRGEPSKYTPKVDRIKEIDEDRELRV